MKSAERGVRKMSKRCEPTLRNTLVPLLKRRQSRCDAAGSRVATLLRGLVFPLILASASYACAADTVVVGTVGSASANLWPVFIGLNKGMFAEKDIKIDLVYVQSSAAVVAQLTAGSLDVTMSTGLVDPIRAIEKGAPIAIVRFESQSPPYALVAKPNIKSLRDLKGKVISLGGAKDITRIYVERMLAPSGIKPGEFDMVFAGATAAWFEDDRNRAEAVAMMVKASGLKADEVEKAYDFYRRGEFFDASGRVSIRRLKALIGALESLGDLPPG